MTESARERFPALPPEARAISFEVIGALSASLSGITEARQAVLDDAEAWGDYWQEFYSFLAPLPEPEPFDATRDAVLAVALGTRPSAGFQVTVDGVFDTDGERYVLVVESEPGEGCMSGQMLSAPAVAVRVPASSLPVRFLTYKHREPCP